MLKTTTPDRIGELDPTEWDALAGEDPFLRHAFLAGLEASGCVGPGTGWHPAPVILRDAGGRLVGAAPMYLKDHSFGEFVFDWGWADAARRNGIPYYPKLVAAVPFSPVTGRRLLVHPDADPGPVRERLLTGAWALAERWDCGAVQWLFPTAEEQALLTEAGYLPREDVQFHWANPGYADFDQFLAALSSAKRKQIRKERRRAAEGDWIFHTRLGHEVPDSLWAAFHAAYARTTEMRGAPAYLNADFFRRLGRDLGERVVLITAERDGELVAGALNLRSERALYGRYWAAAEEHDFLHFELCYYRGMDFCIARGLERFEGGAQGEHKLKRGFEPAITYSTHWIRHDGLRAAVADYLTREQEEVAAYAEAARAELPFKGGG